MRSAAGLSSVVPARELDFSVGRCRRWLREVAAERRRRVEGRAGNCNAI